MPKWPKFPKRNRRTKPAKTLARHPKRAKTSTTAPSLRPKLLTIAEAAGESRLSRPTIVRAYNTGELRVFRTRGGGRVLIHSTSLDAWIEKNSVGAGRR